jgi:hypothetical protein
VPPPLLVALPDGVPSMSHATPAAARSVVPANVMLVLAGSVTVLLAGPPSVEALKPGRARIVETIEPRASWS